jgi:hypothetical protein
MADPTVTDVTNPAQGRKRWVITEAGTAQTVRVFGTGFAGEVEVELRDAAGQFSWTSPVTGTPGATYVDVTSTPRAVARPKVDVRGNLTVRVTNKPTGTTGPSKSNDVDYVIQA